MVVGLAAAVGRRQVLRSVATLSARSGRVAARGTGCCCQVWTPSGEGQLAIPRRIGGWSVGASAFSTSTAAMAPAAPVVAAKPFVATPLRKGLTIDDVNDHVRKAEYAVRGKVVLAAQELAKKMKADPSSVPFSELVYCNIGNPQSLGQQPITFFREVCALCDYPALLDHPEVHSLFSEDAIARARRIIAGTPGGTGAYSDSRGVDVCRKDVAYGIEKRDGYPCNYENIFLTDGASAGVRLITQCLIKGPETGILTPIPQYPLYSASIALYDGSLLPYQLDESKGWATDVEQLRKIVASARMEGIGPKALVVINPGNPTGQCLSKENQVEIVNLCVEEGILLLADEVYQENVYAAGKSFESFKKVACDMGVDRQLQLISFHSVSKGYYGECGKRGGYFEMINVAQEVIDQMYKLSSINLCSNIVGQVMMSLVARPPEPSDSSYPLYKKERDAILASLAERARVVVDNLRKLEGFTCNDVEGALYAMPQLQLPPKAVAAAKDAGFAADTFYTLELLHETGVVVVPGSGFGQAEGTWHFRTTILPPLDALLRVLDRMAVFHAKFMDKYR